MNILKNNTIRWTNVHKHSQQMFRAEKRKHAFHKITAKHVTRRFVQGKICNHKAEIIVASFMHLMAFGVCV